MNRPATAVLLAAALFQAGPAAAQDSLPARAFSALGHAIAQQGNQALRDIRDEMRERLLRDLKPVLPQPAPASRPQPAQRQG